MLHKCKLVLEIEQTADKGNIHFVAQLTGAVAIMMANDVKHTFAL